MTTASGQYNKYLLNMDFYLFDILEIKEGKKILSLYMIECCKWQTRNHKSTVIIQTCRKFIWKCTDDRKT